MISEELKKSVMRDLTLLRFVGINVVLVHGGGPEISETLKRMGVESRFVNGLRYTDEETAEVVRMVLAGKVNKELVHRLQMLGAKSVGMCGIDGGMLLCEKESDELGYVGKIVSVNTGVITDSLANGYLPSFPPSDTTTRAISTTSTPIRRLPPSRGRSGRRASS